MNVQADLAADLTRLAEQERLLVFRSFSADDAWRLGSLLREALVTESRQRMAAAASAIVPRVGGSVEIEVAGHLLFRCVTVGATPGQANWIRRKRNTVHHFAQSTYAVGRKLEAEGGTLLSRHALNEADFAAHGGGFPLQLAGTGMVGSVVLSGLPQRDDHRLVVDALATLLGIEVPRLL